jgi:hypothetical protein
MFKAFDFGFKNSKFAILTLVLVSLATTSCSDNGKPKVGAGGEQPPQVWAKENCKGSKNKSTILFSSWVPVDTDLSTSKVEELNFRKGTRRQLDRMTVSLHCKSPLDGAFVSTNRTVWADVRNDEIDIDFVPAIEASADGRICRRAAHLETTVEYSFRGKCLVLDGDDGTQTTFMPADDFWDLVLNPNRVP